MYGVLENTKLIAIHEDLSIVEKFVKYEKNEDYLTVKIKKKKWKSLKDDPSLKDIYLTRYGDRYVPFHLYETLQHMDDESAYELQLCKDVLKRISQNKNLSSKDIKALARTILIIEKEMEKTNTMPMKSISSIKEMDDMYKKSIQ